MQQVPAYKQKLNNAHKSMIALQKRIKPLQVSIHSMCSRISLDTWLRIIMGELKIKCWCCITRMYREKVSLCLHVHFVVEKIPSQFFEVFLIVVGVDLFSSSSNILKWFYYCFSIVFTGPLFYLVHWSIKSPTEWYLLNSAGNR